jgi:hypothetical protein
LLSSANPSLPVLDPRFGKDFFDNNRYELDLDVQMALEAFSDYLDAHYTGTPLARPTPSFDSAPVGPVRSLSRSEALLRRDATASGARRPSEELAEYRLVPHNLMLPADQVLMYWKEHEPRWPQLARAAFDILSVPGTPASPSYNLLLAYILHLKGSSVGVERTFSGGRDLISIRRHTLKGDTIRKLMISKAWLRRRQAEGM